MLFNDKSSIVQSYVLLINKDMRTIDDVPNIFNLIQAVTDCLAS